MMLSLAAECLKISSQRPEPEKPGVKTTKP
jgi:hypothetical protein